MAAQVSSSSITPQTPQTLAFLSVSSDLKRPKPFCRATGTKWARTLTATSPLPYSPSTSACLCRMDTYLGTSLRSPPLFEHRIYGTCHVCMYVWWSKMTTGVRGEAVQPPAKCEVNHLTLARYRWSIQSAIPRMAARSRSATNRGAVIDECTSASYFQPQP